MEIRVSTELSRLHLTTQFLSLVRCFCNLSELMARRSSGGRSARPAPRRAPAPAPVRQAPPPAPAQAQSGGGSLLGSIGSTIAQGMAFGTGSAVAHRAVDAVMGPRTVQHEMNSEPAATAAAAAPMSSNSGLSEACSMQSKSFQDCLSSYGNDISKCQFYMDMLAECRRNSGSMMSS